METVEDFSKHLKKATRDVHNISDVLVNAKFALALSDDNVWADGLLSFYEIYKFLEANLTEEFLPKELHRMEGFQKDLSYFLGEDWEKNYELRPSVIKYLDHLQTVRDRSQILLFAYAFQMYMALMSGAQMLQKKRMIARKIWISKDEKENADSIAQVTICPPGCAATYFSEKIPTLKANLRAVLNEKYKEFDDQMKKDFVEESRNVFIFNNEVIRSVKGVNMVGLRKLSIILVVIIGVYLGLKFANQ